MVLTNEEALGVGLGAIFGGSFLLAAVSLAMTPKAPPSPPHCSTCTCNAPKPTKDTLPKVIKQLQEEIGDTTPAVHFTDQGTLVLEKNVEFNANTCVIQEASKDIQRQIETNLVTLYKIASATPGVEMYHIHFDGHTAKGCGGDYGDMLSYFRAAELINRVVKAGVPRKFLHPMGYGDTIPNPDGGEEMRVDFKVMEYTEVDAANTKALELWAKMNEPHITKTLEGETKDFGLAFRKFEDYAPIGAPTGKPVKHSAVEASLI